MNGADAAKIACSGDVLVFSRTVSWATLKMDWKGTLMCALIHLTTGSRYNHAALALGDGKMVEAVASGVRIDDISSTADDVTVIHIPTDPPSRTNLDDLAYWDEGDREHTVGWATKRAGEKYGYLNAVMCGVNNVLVGLHLEIKATDSIICSELVAEALEHGGFDFDKDSGQVSPGDLATFFRIPRK